MKLIIENVGIDKLPVEGLRGLRDAQRKLEAYCRATEQEEKKIEGMQEIIQVLKVRIEDYNKQ